MCYARDSNLLLNNTASIYVYKGERHTDTSVWWGDPRVKIRNLWLKEGSQGKKVFRWLFFFLGEFSLFSGGLAPNGTTTTTTRNRSTVVWAWWGAIRPRTPPSPAVTPAVARWEEEEEKEGWKPPHHWMRYVYFFLFFFSKSNSSCSKRKCLLFIFWKHLAFGTKIIIRG